MYSYLQQDSFSITFGRSTIIHQGTKSCEDRQGIGHVLKRCYLNCIYTLVRKINGHYRLLTEQ